MNETKKNNLIKARKYNIFKFIGNIHAINDRGEFESNHCNIYPKEWELGKENTDKHEGSLWDLDIKTKDGKFQVDIFNKRDSLPLTSVKMPDMPSNIPSNIVYSAIGAESLNL